MPLLDAVMILVLLRYGPLGLADPFLQFLPKLVFILLKVPSMFQVNELLVLPSFTTLEDSQVDPLSVDKVLKPVPSTPQQPTTSTLIYCQLCLSTDGIGD